MSISGRSLLKNTATNLAGQALPLVAAFVCIPAATSSLGSARFGVVSFIWVLLSILTVFDLGLSRATTKYVASALGDQRQEDIAPILWTTIALQGALGVVSAVAFCLAVPLTLQTLVKVPPPLMHEAQLSLWLISAAIPLTLFYNSFRGVLEAAQRFDLVNAIRSPLVAANFAVPAFAGHFHIGLVGMVNTLLALRVLALLAAAAQVRRLFPTLSPRPTWQPDRAKSLLRFGGWVAVSSFLNPSLAYLDRLLLGAFVPLNLVGQYAIIHETTTRMSVIPASIVSVLFPSIATLDGSASELTKHRLVERATRLLFLAVAPITIILTLLASPLLELWVGQSVARTAAPALSILALGFLANSMTYIPFTYLQAVGRPDLTAKSHLLELPIHIVVASILVWKYGATGAAMAWTVRVVGDLALLSAVAARTGLSITTIASRELRIAAGLVCVLAVAALLLVSWTPSGQVRQLLLMAGLLGVSLPLIARIASTAQERHVLLAALRKRSS